jgi:hypothetical protein
MAKKVSSWVGHWGGRTRERILIHCMTSVGLKTVNITIMVLWVLTSHSLVHGYQSFGETCCLHLLLCRTNGSKTRRFRSPYSSYGCVNLLEPCISRPLQSYGTHLPNRKIDRELLCSVLLHVLL